MNWKLLRKIAIEFGTTNRSYYTSRTKKPSLYSKISPLGNPTTNIVPELDDWIYKGNKVCVGELQRIVRDLRKRRRFNQALQVFKFFTFYVFINKMKPKNDFGLSWLYSNNPLPCSINCSHFFFTMLHSI